MIIIVIVGAELKDRLPTASPNLCNVDGMVRTAGVRQDNRETKKISWSIKESEFAALMSFPSSFCRERSSMMVSSGPLKKVMDMEMVEMMFQKRFLLFSDA